MKTTHHYPQEHHEEHRQERHQERHQEHQAATPPPVVAKPDESRAFSVPLVVCLSLLRGVGGFLTVFGILAVLGTRHETGRMPAIGNLTPQAFSIGFLMFGLTLALGGAIPLYRMMMRVGGIVPKEDA